MTVAQQNAINLLNPRLESAIQSGDKIWVACAACSGSGDDGYGRCKKCGGAGGWWE